MPPPAGSSCATRRPVLGPELRAAVRATVRPQLFFSYVRAGARGDLNDFASYLGSFPVPIIRANQFGNLPADLPNRFLAWGLVQLPWGFQIARAAACPQNHP